MTGSALVLSFLSAASLRAQDIGPLERAVCSDRPTATSPIFQTAINNIGSFHYVNHALERVRRDIAHPVFCVSGFALSKNMYQYVRSYLQIDVYDEAGARRYGFRFLFQDASTQAFHNVGGQPWNGLSPVKADGLLAAWAASTVFVPFVTAETDPVKIAQESRTYRLNREDADLSTLSLFRLPVTDRELYVVNWLGRSPLNPYVAPAVARAVMIAIGPDGAVSVAENLSPFSEALVPLDEALGETTQDVRGRDWTEALLDLGRLISK